MIVMMTVDGRFGIQMVMTVMIIPPVSSSS